MILIKMSKISPKFVKCLLFKPRVTPVAKILHPFGVVSNYLSFCAICYTHNLNYKEEKRIKRLIVLPEIDFVRILRNL
jgi:hypothetical protein